MIKGFWRYFICVLALMFLLPAIIYSLTIDPFLKTVNAGEVMDGDGGYSIVASYETIFQSYYDQFISETETKITFNEFCNGFYEYDLTLPEYTTLLSNDSIKDDNVSDVLSSSPSNDADYILSASDYSITPESEFKRFPTNENYIYDYILPGDIVFETSTVFFNAGHTAIISDQKHTAQYSGGYFQYIQTIEAVGGGVQFGFLDDTRMVNFQVYILRAKGTTESTRNQVMYFCRGQLGKPYSFSFTRKNTSYYSSKWMCSELVYAAYLYAGIDIEVRKEADGSNSYGIASILPQDIWSADAICKCMCYLDWIGDS